MCLNRFLVVLIVFALFSPAEAQQRPKVYRIGCLSISSRESVAHLLNAFEERLSGLGYMDGRNVVFERRFADGNPERLPGLAAGLVELNVNIILAYGATSTRAAKNATNAIPIVMMIHPDPVSTGLVISLAQPGGNVTGLARLSQELGPKRLELLKETVPKLSRATVLVYHGSRDADESVKLLETAAHPLGIQLQVLAVGDPTELEAAFGSTKKDDSVGLILVPSTVLFDSRAAIGHVATKYRLPGVFPEREFVDAGGLMSYGTSLADEFRRAAIYVDKILKGNKPAELPVQQPTKFELVINLKTAKQIGVTIPQSVLYRADKVIK